MRPWGEWRGPMSSLQREGEPTRPGEQRETPDQRREREAAKAKAQTPRPQADRPPQGDAAPQETAEPPVEGFTPTRPARDRHGRFTSHPEPPQEGVLRLTPRQPRAQLVKALASWLRADLSKGPVAAASIRAACRKRKIRAQVLREACQRAGVVSYIEEDGAEAWGVLHTGRCPHCSKMLRCAECGATTVYPHREGILLTVKQAAPLCLMKPDSLRAYLNRHKEWYTPRYRRRRGGSRERVLTSREVQMLQAYAVRSLVYGKRKIGAALANDEEGR